MEIRRVGWWDHVTEITFNTSLAIFTSLGDARRRILNRVGIVESINVPFQSFVVCVRNHFRWTSSLPFNDQVVCNRISWHCFRFTATLKIYFEKCDGDCFLGEEILVSSAGREVESHVEYKMGKSWLIVKLSLKLSRRLTNGKDEKETPRLSCCCRQMVRVDIQREKAM